MTEFAFSASLTLDRSEPSEILIFLPVGYRRYLCDLASGQVDRTSIEPRDTNGDSFSSGSFSRRHRSHHPCRCYARRAGCSCKLLCR